MKLSLVRFIFGEVATIGKLSIEDNFFAYTLEDKVRPKGVKIAGATAIPFGEYQVTIDQSQRFKRLMPHVLNVPMFEGIRIHSGNTDKDTLGCILVGMKYSKTQLLESHVAFDILFPKLQEALKNGKISLTIS